MCYCYHRGGMSRDFARQKIKINIKIKKRKQIGKMEKQEVTIIRKSQIKPGIIQNLILCTTLRRDKVIQHNKFRKTCHA